MSEEESWHNSWSLRCVVRMSQVWVMNSTFLQIHKVACNRFIIDPTLWFWTPLRQFLYSTKLPYFRFMLVSSDYNLFANFIEVMFYWFNHLINSWKENLTNLLTLQYVATLREQLEQLAEEKTPEGLPR